MTAYLDNNATTPLRPEVWDAMARVEFGPEQTGNPSSTHRPGLAASRMVREAREVVARTIGADIEEIVFTGGGSEAINHALKGAVWASRKDRKHIVTTAVEHHAVLHAVEWLATQGCELTVVPVSLKCRVDPAAIAEAIRPDTALVSVMAVNNEVGTIQPVEEIGAICRERGVLYHVDAVQALGKLPLDVERIGCDLLSVSAHKLGGPKGVGALYIRKGTPLAPLIHGGRQESQRRGGTHNVAGIVGFGEATRLAEEERSAVLERWGELRGVLQRLPKELNAVRINSDPALTLPNCISATFLYCDGMALATNLSMRGIYVSTGAACSSGNVEPSHVLKAMGLSDLAAYCTIRFSLGYGTTRDECEEAVRVTKELVELLREVTMPEDIGRCTEDCPCFLTA